MTEHALSVRRLRFRNRIANPLAVRGRVETALAGANTSRLGVEAILCVRRIAISLPQLDRLSGALDAEMLSAARPAHSFVPANANAVFFADRAELLACLARDWCAGNTNTSWWWPVLFPRDDLTAIVRRVWLKDVRPVPAALARLESVGLSARFMAKLSPADVAALWRNIVNTFHLGAFDAAWDWDGTASADMPPLTPSRDAAPWSPWIEPHSSLPPEAARVLIAAILLVRAPAVVRSISFAREVRALSHPRETHRVPKLASNKMFPLVVPGGFPSIVRWMLHPKRVAPAGAPKAQSAVAQTFFPRSLPSERSTNARMRKDRSRADRFEKGAPTSSSVARTEESVALPSPASPDRIATEWGGSLYIVNVAISLGLYGDFTTPARSGLALPLWDFLALIGKKMIGDAFAADPLPALFARLSGRADEEPPGAEFEPPTGETLGIWLHRVCHDVQVRTTASLGLGHACDLRAFVLNHNAKIETTSTRMDVHFALATHPIQLRMAGLDRDPGWVPAGGRSIYFHYD